MSIWEYANPKKFMQTSARALPWAVGLTAVLLAVGLVWGFFFTPDGDLAVSVVQEGLIRPAAPGKPR